MNEYYERARDFLNSRRLPFAEPDITALSLMMKEMEDNGRADEYRLWLAAADGMHDPNSDGRAKCIERIKAAAKEDKAK